MAKNKIRIEDFVDAGPMEYIVDLTNPRTREKFIKRVEKIVRSALEYRDYTNFLREFMDMKSCAFFKGLENEPGHKIRIEIHHEPFTLYDISKTVLNKFIEEGLVIDDLLVADEVLDIHYQNLVGLVPLSKSVHEIVHNSDELTIPLQLVYGDYKRFIAEYSEYFDDIILDKIENKIDEARAFTPEMINKLTPEFVYVQVKGFELPSKMALEEAIEISKAA